MSNNKLTIGNEWLSFEEVKNTIQTNATIQITSEAEILIKKCRLFLDEKLSDGEGIYYGINTGFGFLQNVKIDKKQI